jgi:hypothetical protein
MLAGGDLLSPAWDYLSLPLTIFVALGAADILIPVSISPEMKLNTIYVICALRQEVTASPTFPPLFGAILSSGVLEVMWKNCA